MGCTDCGRKGGCDSRKQSMFTAIDEALLRFYPTRRWGERDDGAVLHGGAAPESGELLARDLAQRLGAQALWRPGDPDEWCDYVYVLCLGRTPSIVEMREGLAPAAEAGDGDDDGLLEERYLRVVLSALGPFAGVQEVAMTLRRDGGDLFATERTRAGVFDPILLRRFQTLVAVLAEHDLRHLDFGEITTAPADFDPADYPSRYGASPVIANYFFFPRPPTEESTVLVSSAAAAPHPSPLPVGTGRG
jgi:hypothetical protein